jgi:neutral ceramidase
VTLSGEIPMHRRRSWTLLLIAITFSAASASAQEKKFRAGAFAMDIVPSTFPVSVNGGMQDRQAKTAHDRLHARTVVLDDGTTKIALVVCDSCMIPRDIIDAAKALARKETGIPPERILISATHTHSAPTLRGAFQSEPNEDYIKELPAMIAAGIAKANDRLAPAKIGWAVGKDPAQVFNRRWKVKPGSTLLINPFSGTDQVKMNPGHKHADLIEPAGPTDPEITLLSVQTPEGRPVALLANYSLHYVGGFPELSADYFGAYAEKMRELLDADKAFVGIMSNGTSGNINNVNYAAAGLGKQEPGEQIRIVTDSVAKASLAAYKTIKHHDWVPLAMAQKEIELAVRRPTEDEVARAEDILKKANKKVLTTLPEVYARETTLMAKFPPKVKLVLQAIRIGELGIVANPCETFVEIGLEIKQKSPLRPTCTIELANGYNGYLPTPEHHVLGGYETWRARSSYLEVNASRVITDTLLGLLRDVAK